MLLNIGLIRGEGEAIPPEAALYAVRLLGRVEPIRWAVHRSDTEPTLIVDVPPMPRLSISAIARWLGQDAIAVSYGGASGDLIGPNAEAWGAFDPTFFLNLDGSRLDTAREAA